MNAKDIELISTTKLFEYERISREIDSCNDINELKEKLKTVTKLYMKQEETVAMMLKNM